MRKKARERKQFLLDNIKKRYHINMVGAREGASVYVHEAAGRGKGRVVVAFKVDGERGHTGMGDVEDLLSIALGRVKYLNSIVPSHYNITASIHIRKALEAMYERTEDRERRGVKGTFDI